VVAVPDYQTLMAPVLHALSDGLEQPIPQLRNIIAKQVGLTDEDLKATLPSGSRLFVNRLHWTITYLYQAGLVRRPRRAVVQITSRGQDVLAEHPDRVDNSILLQFKEFTEFQSRTRGDASPAQAGGQEPPVPSETTPVETIARAVAEANSAVAAEVLERVREREPAFLELLVLNVLTALGYRGAAGSAEHLGRSGDNGLDGVIRQDPLGLDQIYVQAKRYAAGHTVGRPEIQGFVGALHGAQADRGVFITTSSFTNEAITYADRVSARVILIDGITLAQLMVTHNIGVQDREVFVIKRVDEDFFEET
jgi:restriction system protein